ncbi:MAG: phage head morphogenesis protein, partial [Spirochaetes bacterium]|nr:phage head morphogenesis protein [Spirochaetota bacterium]
VWNEEHATAFTVAKAMQIDVLSDLHNAVIQAVEKGQSFESFKKNIKPTLQQKGWWGRKKMEDPLTGKTVDALQGSDRRLKTIYNVNMRSAYQKGQYDRTMQSDLHPYLMYRIGPSVKHREEHEKWDGLVLPKDDPFWDSHFPPNGWGCKCYTRAVTESQRKKYEAEGIAVPTRADGTGGGKIKIKTEAPPITYRNFFNERTGTLESIPKGISPGFNWNQAKPNRSTAALEQMVQKTREKTPEQFDGIINSVLKSQVNKNNFYGFIEDALEKKQDRQHFAVAGVLDSKITNFLLGKKIDLSKNPVIILESKLVNGYKYTGKHTLMGNAPSKNDWYNIIDWLIDAPIFWDSKGLIYLAKISDSRYMKIAVDVNLKTKALRGLRYALPKIDTVYLLDLAQEGDRGSNEFNRIMRMEKVR